jgi:hypothetical protein
MRHASLLDRLTLYGGAALFALVVLYILAKRSAYFVPAGLVPSLPAFAPSSLLPANASLLPALGAAWNATAWAAWKLAALGGRGAKLGGAGQPMKLGGGGGRFGVVPPAAEAPKANWDEWAGRASRAHWDAGGRGREGEPPAEPADGGAQEWPDPNDPAYEEPVMRCRSPAACWPASGLGNKDGCLASGEC